MLSRSLHNNWSVRKVREMRVNWVDNAKALGIATIVLGHGPGLTVFVRDFFYTFHVPLFFFLSGVLLKQAHLQVPFGQFAKRNANRLITPYVFFWFFSFLLWVAFQVAGGEAIWKTPGVLIEQVAGLFEGTSSGLQAVNGVLWFYTSLFVTALVLYFFAQLSAQKFFGILLLFAVLGAAVPLVLEGAHLPWNVDLIPVAMVFYGAGYLVAREQWIDGVSAKSSAWWAIVAFGVTVVVTLINKKVDMSWQVFGESYALYLLGAFAGSVFIIAIAKLLPATRVARYLSDNAIIIFSIHFPMFFAFWGIGAYVFKLPRDFDQHSWFFAVGYSLAAFVVCIPLIYIIRRYMAWGLGARARTQN